MIDNTARSWGSVARAFHWSGAALILFLLGHGFWMTEFAARDARLAHYSTHAAVGYALLALIVLRLLWRWTQVVPALPAAAGTLERFAGRAAHWGLYLLMLAASLSGWALAGTFRQPLDSFFGLFRMPQLVSGQDRALHQTLEHWHEWLAWALLLLVVGHIAGALWHRLYRKDEVLQRMLRQL